LVEQLRYNLLLRWFVGLPLDQPVFHVTSFTKNRARLLTMEVAEAFFCAIRSQAEAHKLLSREHFSVEGTLLEAAAALKSLRPLAEDEGEEPPPSGGTRNPDVDFHGQRRGNQIHGSRTDPEARLARKGAGKEARLCYAGHTPDREPAWAHRRVRAHPGIRHRRAAGRPAPAGPGARPPRSRAHEHRRRPRLRHSRLRRWGARPGRTPHVAAKQRGSAIDGRTSRHASYAVSLRRRKLIEEGYGWMKGVGGLRKLRHRGQAKVSAVFTFTCAAYNLVRLRKLLAEPSLA